MLSQLGQQELQDICREYQCSWRICCSVCVYLWKMRYMKYNTVLDKLDALCMWHITQINVLNKHKGSFIFYTLLTLLNQYQIHLILNFHVELFVVTLSQWEAFSVSSSKHSYLYYWRTEPVPKQNLHKHTDKTVQYDMLKNLKLNSTKLPWFSVLHRSAESADYSSLKQFKKSTLFLNIAAVIMT